MKILITGCAGFIGFHITKLLLKEKYSIIGVDNINNYYDVKLKKDRLAELKKISLKEKSIFTFKKIDLSHSDDTNQLFRKYQFDYIIHLAAQAGVRHSIQFPMDYISSNITAFTNILEGCKSTDLKHLIYASTSSVYGSEKTFPLSEDLACNKPLQLYAATKKANEMMAYAYSSLFNLPSTGLRFFTVYGPWGRPDMALFKFTKSIIEEKEIEIFNNGNHVRDFTYVEDIAEGIKRLISKPPKSEAKKNSPPTRVLNIGSNNPINLLDFLNIIENKLGKVSKIKYLPIQMGDIVSTHASIKEFTNITNYQPSTGIKDGISNFIEWYCEYYKIKLGN